MNLTAEQLQIASMMEAKVQGLMRAGGDDFTIFAEMVDYMPSFKRLMDTVKPSGMDQLAEPFEGFFIYAKILERVAMGIASGNIKVPK